jgi:hypothetical protein
MEQPPYATIRLPTARDVGSRPVVGRLQPLAGVEPEHGGEGRPVNVDM